MLDHPLLKIIGEKLQIAPSSIVFSKTGGGSINDTYKMDLNNGRSFFVKTNKVSGFPGLLEKEQDGLAFLAKQKIISVPEIVACGKTDLHQFLVLEWIQEGVKNPEFWKSFGSQLARLHQTSHPHFGFHENNYMGSLPQRNDFSESWTGFFIHHRLKPQIHLAAGKNLLTQNHILSFEILFKKLDTIFNRENPSLLHGDLWSGNFMCNSESRPVLIDPAVYFGHRNMDLGMTSLFGGFDKLFYESYQYHFALPENYREQWSVCNLYPLLIHLNLFGRAYLQDIEMILKKFTG